MILETKVTTFKNTTTIDVMGNISIESILDDIETGEYLDTITKLRNGDEDVKKWLPTIAMHGIFEHSRKKENFIEASGIIILDIDDVALDEIEETKEAIMEDSDHVLAVMVSPSGNGIKVLYYVNPDLINANNYRQIGKQLVSDFETYGDVDFLSVTDCLIMTYDPNILINEDATPAFIYIDDTIEVTGTLEERNEGKELWDDPEEFYRTVLLNDIEGKTNNNFHFIQVSILDLAKFGFKHPTEDLSFVIDYAEEAFKKSKDNQKRFLEVTELAKTYPQIKWPYRLGSNSDSEEEYIDYSDYAPDPDSIRKKSSEKSDGDEDEEEIENDGLVNYETFFDRVLDTVKEGDRVGFEISLKQLADVFRIKGTGILTITGIPGHGKTEFVDVMTVDLARLYGHETVIAGFEQSPSEHTIKLIRKMAGVDVTCPSWFNDKNMNQLKEYYDFIIKYFTHIDTNKVGGNVNKILEVAAKRIKKSRDEGGNPRYLVIDPFNMLSIKGKFNGHEKVEEILRRLTHFSHQMDILVMLVAHPFKMKTDEKTGEYNVPDFYSVKGSSAFFEMSYHGITVYRKNDGSVLIKILKVKQNNLGKTGAEVYFLYDKPSGRYIPIDEEGNELPGDQRTKNWLELISK